MKALITAGGRGTRLRPLTFTNNKHLIPIANKPIIEYAIEAVREAGITDIGITYNYGLEELQSYLGEGERYEVSITYIHQQAPIGLADCVRAAEDFIGHDKFVFYLGDNMLAGGIKEFVEEFAKDTKTNCLLLLAKVPDPERFGVAEINKKGDVIRTVEKPTSFISDRAITGIYFFDHHIFKAFKGKDAIKPSARGELEIPDAFQYLIDHGYTVHAKNVSGWWKDTGKMNDLLLANRLILEKGYTFEIDGNSEDTLIEGEVAIAKGAKVINSHIRGPVVIGEGSIVENSYIGPFTSIDKNCVIRNSEIRKFHYFGRCPD